MKANHSYEVMQLTRGGTAATHCKEMAISLPSIGSVGSVMTVPVHHTTNLQTNNVKNQSTNRSSNKKTSVPAYTSSQSPSEEKSTRLPCETDHMYANYQQSSVEAGKCRELATEVAQLKALLLFHLDLIQQQSECNASKDKQLSALRHENEMLRQRLERMERRVILQNQKVKQEPSTEEPAVTGKTNDSALSTSVQSSATNSYELRGFGATDDTKSRLPEPVSGSVSPFSKDEENPVPKKRIKTLMPVGSKLSPAPSIGTIGSRERNSKVLTPVNTTGDLKLVKKEDEHILDDLINQAVKEGAIILTDTNQVDGSILDTKVVLEPCELPVVQLTTDKFVESQSPPEQASAGKTEKKISSRQSIAILPEHKRIQQLLIQKPPPRELNSLKRESILTTEQPYFTHVGEAYINHQVEFQAKESEVEVPQWCVKPVNGRHSTQGIENLDDEVFTKRHLKHELDEKRRKRWDLQRIREQRQYEKLRARYEGEDRSQDRRSTSSSSRGRTGDSETATETSLWSQPEDVSHLQVEHWLPVTAFGAPIVNVSPTEFTLPWACTRPNPGSRYASETGSKKRQRR